MELLQINDPLNGQSRLKSLDSDYWFDISSNQYETAIDDHVPLNDRQIELKKGDSLKLLFYIPAHLKVPRVRKYIFDGYKNATNLRTNKSGLYPAYKSIEWINVLSESVTHRTSVYMIWRTVSKPKLKTVFIPLFIINFTVYAFFE